MTALKRADTTRLEEISKELERSASQLQSGEVDLDVTTALVSRCAELASQATVELDRLASTTPEGSLPGQEELL